MSSSPADVSDREKVFRYGESWGEMMHAVRGGTSWSGSERNRCLLNLAGSGFADASSMSGLDVDDDGRAVAVTDWNRDGRPDLWFRNRTAPRLRLMVNQVKGGRSLSLRLEGVTCNRDAIGAVVEFEVGGKPLLRSVRAGEMFLSQSSRWLHFGLGEEDVKAVTVFWPGGQKEEFRGLEADGRFLLRQGAGTAIAVMDPVPIQMKHSDLNPGASGGEFANVRLPVAMSVPALVYRDAALKQQQLTTAGRPKLIMIWESSCETCYRDLKALEARKQELANEGLDVLALSADKLEDPGTAYGRIDGVRYSGAWGFCDPGSLRALWKWQGAVFDRRIPPSVPFGILLDGRGQGVALYRGGIDLDLVLRDARELTGIDARTRWHLAPPLRGSWFTNPPADDYVLNVIRARMKGRD